MTKSDVEIQRELSEIDLEFTKIIWVNEMERVLIDSLGEAAVEEYLIEKGFGKQNKKHINDLIAAYCDLGVEQNITLPSIAEAKGEPLN